MSSYSNSDKLSASLVSDLDINSDRSNPLRNDIAAKVEPGAIGNGAPLIELAQGKLPPKVTLKDDDRPAFMNTTLKHNKTHRKILNAINEALSLAYKNKLLVPLQHRDRVKQTLANLINLRDNLSKYLYLFNADVRSSEDYLLGFNFQNYRGFSIELIESLYEISRERLAQYIFHECVPEKGIITERDDHRVVYNEIQSAIFGEDEVLALKKDLRGFITTKINPVSSGGEKLNNAGFVIGGVNTNEIIEQLTELTGVSIKEIERRGQPGAYSASGFLAEGEKFKDLLKTDNAFVASKGFNHQQLAEPLFYVMNIIYEAAASGRNENKAEFTYKGKKYQVSVQRWRGGQESIFNDELGSSQDFTVRNIETGASISFSALIPHYIQRYGFYEGHTDYRVEPAKIIDVFFAGVVPVSTAIPSQISAAPEVVETDIVTRISKDLPVHALEFKVNLTKILAEHPDQLFFMGIETNIGESQKAQIMPIYKAIDEIRELKDAGGKPLFPNLMVRRGKADELVSMVTELSRAENTRHNGIEFGTLDVNRAFIGARQISVKNNIYSAIQGEGRAWISAIDDSRSGDYLPVFEAITLNMMAYLNADAKAIENFYNDISDKPIDPAVLQEMVRNRIIYILPRLTKFDTEKQQRQLYELAQQIYVAA